MGFSEGMPSGNACEEQTSFFFKDSTMTVACAEEDCHFFWLEKLSFNGKEGLLFLLLWQWKTIPLFIYVFTSNVWRICFGFCGLIWWLEKNFTFFAKENSYFKWEKLEKLWERIWRWKVEETPCGVIQISWVLPFIWWMECLNRKIIHWDTYRIGFSFQFKIRNEPIISQLYFYEKYMI